MKIIYRTSGTTSGVPTFASWRCQKEKREIENLFEKMTSPGSTESPKQDEPKEAHNKTHQN